MQLTYSNIKELIQIEKIDWAKQIIREEFARFSDFGLLRDTYIYHLLKYSQYFNKSELEFVKSFLPCGKQSHPIWLYTKDFQGRLYPVFLNNSYHWFAVRNGEIRKLSTQYINEEEIGFRYIEHWLMNDQQACRKYLSSSSEIVDQENFSCGEWSLLPHGRYGAHTGTWSIVPKTTD